MWFKRLLLSLGVALATFGVQAQPPAPAGAAGGVVVGGVLLGAPPLPPARPHRALPQKPILESLNLGRNNM